MKVENREQGKTQHGTNYGVIVLSEIKNIRPAKRTSRETFSVQMISSEKPIKR